MPQSLKMNRRYFCREKTSPEHVAGFFEFTENDMALTLFSFEEHFRIEHRESISAQLENGQRLTMFDNIGPGIGEQWTHTSQHIYWQKIQSNTVVVGPKEWVPDQKVHYAEFHIPQTYDMLTPHATRDQITRKGPDDHSPYNRLLDITVGDIRVRIDYSTMKTHFGTTPVEMHPFINIEFRNGRPLGKYLEDIYDVISFLSASLGLPLHLHDLQISP